MDDSVVTAPPWPVNLLTRLLRRRPFGSRVHMIDQRRSDRDAFLKRQHGTEWVKPQMKVWLMVVSFFAKHQPGVPEFFFQSSQLRWPGIRLAKPMFVYWTCSIWGIWRCQRTYITIRMWTSTYSPGRASQKLPETALLPAWGVLAWWALKWAARKVGKVQILGIWMGFLSQFFWTSKAESLKGSQHVKKPWFQASIFATNRWWLPDLLWGTHSPSNVIRCYKPARKKQMALSEHGV